MRICFHGTFLEKQTLMNGQKCYGMKLYSVDTKTHEINSNRNGQCPFVRTTDFDQTILLSISFELTFVLRMSEIDERI